ncbi:hypothetical protein [Pectobacterium polonicum]|uniref:hypothetical protein n=1 Tax=Pectobacterium polonicum TaxID=2485124 RepID=UPI0035ABF8BF
MPLQQKSASSQPQSGLSLSLTLIMSIAIGLAAASNYYAQSLLRMQRFWLSVLC